MMLFFIFGFLIGVFFVIATLFFIERKSCVYLPANKGKNGGGDSGRGIICSRFLLIMPGKSGKT